MAKPISFSLDLSSLDNTPANREELKKIIAQIEEIDALKRELGIAGQTDYHGVSAEQLKNCLASFEEQAKAELAQTELLSQTDGSREKILELTEEVAYLKGQLAGMLQTAPAPVQTDIQTMISAVSDDMNELKRSIASMQAAERAEQQSRDAQLLQRLLRSVGGEEETAFTGVNLAAVEYLRADTPDNLSSLLTEVERVLNKAAEKAEDGKIRSSRALVAGVKRRLRPVMLTGSRALAQLRRYHGNLLRSTTDLFRVENVFATFESLGRHFTEQDLTAVIREKIVVFGDETMLSSDHEVCALLSARVLALDATDGEIEALKTELTAFPLSAVLRFDVENYEPRNHKEGGELSSAQTVSADEITTLKAELAALRESLQSAEQLPTQKEEELRALKEEIATLRKQLSAENAERTAEQPLTEGEQAATAQPDAQPTASQPAQTETAADFAQTQNLQGEEPVPQAAPLPEENLKEQDGVLYFDDEEDFVTEVPTFEESAWEDPAPLSAVEEQAPLEAKPAKKREPKPRKTVEVRPIARQKAPFATKQVKITATSAISEELQKKIDELDG